MQQDLLRKGAIKVPEMLTPREISKILKIGYESALAFIKYSGIDYIKAGNQYRVSADKLQGFLSKKGPTHVDLSGGR